MSAKTSAHYGAKYLSWQGQIGEFGGFANAPLFEEFAPCDGVLLDFGCGNGALLERLIARKKVGVEPNPLARSRTVDRGLECVESLGLIPDCSIDCVISNHALEHCLDPLGEAKEMNRVLRNGGVAVVVVPCESITSAFRADDINHHLFTWTPLTLGNLFAEAGFAIRRSEASLYIWPPRIYKLIWRLGGRNVFVAAARAYGWLTYHGLTPTRNNQVRIIAVKV